MTDRVPFTLPGALDSLEDTDFAIAVTGVAGSIIRAHAFGTDAASGDDATINLSVTTGGGGTNITLTIADTEFSDTITDTLAVAATDTIYLRPTEGAGVMNLSGWFEFSPTGVGSISSALTDLATVKADEGITAATYDTQLNRLISGVSVAMQEYMGRTINETTYTDEVHSGNGWQDTIALDHRPITALTTVKQDDTAISSSLYTSNADGGLLYRVPNTVLTTGEVNAWAAGIRNYKVTYDAGWASVPDDLVMAATAQVRHEFHQSQPSDNRLGLASNADATGGTTAYLAYDWLPMVERIMREYRRVW